MSWEIKLCNCVLFWLLVTLFVLFPSFALEAVWRIAQRDDFVEKGELEGLTFNRQYMLKYPA
jgi:hypothetical protein